MERPAQTTVAEPVEPGSRPARLGPFWESDADADLATEPPIDAASLIASQFPDPMMSALVTRLLEGSKDRGEPPDAHADCERALERARRVNYKLRDLLEPANQMVVYIGGLFGACQLCWGLNAGCPQCGGAGKPGWADPQSEELLAWVEPALRRVGLVVVAREESDELVASVGSREGRES
jgi:hypothetical protein